MNKLGEIVKDGEVLDGISMTRKYLTVAVLFFINLINYMDRFTVAGVLLQIQTFFGIDNASAGFIQTVFIISYMVVAPLFGYLGDRFNRKLVILVGMLIWSGCTLLASFINDPNHFWMFLCLRGLVGIGEASYSTVAPTIIADLFVKTQRTRMLSVFFFAIPVGSGLGYIVGSGAAQGFGSWHWALRVTPALGVLTMILMMVIIPNPKRGAMETKTETLPSCEEESSSYLDDLKYIFKNKSFMLVTVAFTFMAFVVGSLTIWGPVYIAYGQIVTGVLAPCTEDVCEYGDVSFIFGLVTCVAGFLGVVIGAESAKFWKDKGKKNADPLVCAIGLLIAGPFLLVGFQMTTINLPVAWSCIFLADLGMCLTWTLVGDMTMYVTMPSRRSTANAVQILTMHLFGDAGSPSLLGVLSDSLISTMPDTYYSKYIALQRAMYVTLFSAAVSGAGFLVTALFIVQDKKKVDDCLAGKTSPTNSTVSDELTPLPTEPESGTNTPVNFPINANFDDATQLQRDSQAEFEPYDNYFSILPENESRPATNRISTDITVEVKQPCDSVKFGDDKTPANVDSGSDVSLLGGKESHV
uniref:Protein spinster homolog 1 n=1 Tax=Phallusia mammillata TaxID=59560 RepID=A0A6F9DUI3_9ASCI|nr:protein spinster homolog 1 [Phallusia mammillata]